MASAAINAKYASLGGASGFLGTALRSRRTPAVTTSITKEALSTIPSPPEPMPSTGRYTRNGPRKAELKAFLAILRQTKRPRLTMHADITTSRMVVPFIGVAQTVPI
jgi:hypothetical protein